MSLQFYIHLIKSGDEIPTQEVMVSSLLNLSKSMSNCTSWGVILNKTLSKSLIDCIVLNWILSTWVPLSDSTQNLLVPESVLNLFSNVRLADWIASPATPNVPVNDNNDSLHALTAS